MQRSLMRCYETHHSKQLGLIWTLSFSQEHPLRNNGHPVLLLFPSGQRPSFFPPRFSLAIRGKSQKISETTPRVLHCEMASHSHAGSEKSPTFAGRRQQILLPRCSAPNFERRTFVPQFLG